MEISNPKPGWPWRTCEAEASGLRGWGRGGTGRRAPPFPAGSPGAGKPRESAAGTAWRGAYSGSRLFDTCLLLLTIHFLRVIYERTSLIRDGFISPLLQLTDAAAKMPGPCCLKGCTPTPSQMLHFSRAISSRASRLYSPTLNPVCSLSCNPNPPRPPQDLNQQKPLGRVSGESRQADLGNTICPVLHLLRSPARYPESSLPGEASCLCKKARTSRPNPTGPCFVETRTLEQERRCGQQPQPAGQGSTLQPF